MLIPHKDQQHGQTFTRWTKKEERRLRVLNPEMKREATPDLTEHSINCMPTNQATRTKWTHS